MLERLERWGVRLYCADDWAAYAELIPQGRLFVGKEETHGIERDHSRQRHWLARFRRRTCVVSKAKRMVEASIALFARFADDRGIDELLSQASRRRNSWVFLTASYAWLGSKEEAPGRQKPSS